MAEKDTATKTLEYYNDVFADIVNVFLFDGEKVIPSDELQPAEKGSYYKAGGKIRHQERDVSKFWQNANIKIAFVGIENQVKPDEAMALRVISYDGAVYRSQYKKKTKKQKYYPVITLVIYFGKENWTYGKTLRDCLEIPERLSDFVSDYKMNFYSIKDMTEQQIEKFQSDFRAIAEFFQALNNDTDYHPTDQILEHPEEVLDMISVFSGDERFRDEYNSLTDTAKQGGVSMCEIYDKIQQEGIEKGRAEGEAKGMAKGILMTLVELVKDGILTLTDAAKRANMTVEEFEIQSGLKA